MRLQWGSGVRLLEGFPKIRGTILGVPIIGTRVLGSMLGSPIFGKVPRGVYLDLPYSQP